MQVHASHELAVARAVASFGIESLAVSNEERTLLGREGGGWDRSRVGLLAWRASSIAHRFAYEGSVEAWEAEGLHGSLQLQLSHQVVSILQGGERNEAR